MLGLGLYSPGALHTGHPLPPPQGTEGPDFPPRNKDSEATYTWPVSWATTNAEEKPSSWFRVQLRTGWHIPVTGA